MKTVTMYTTPTCGYCKMTKSYFEEHNIVFTQKDVAADSTAAEEMIQKSGQMGVPVIVISDQDGTNEKVIIGFDQGALQSAIGISL